MDLVAYESVRKLQSGAGLGVLDREFVTVAGRDRTSFLQGQVSNDVASLTAGSRIRACLLDNTGHLLADLFLHALPDRIVVDAPPGRGRLVAETLEGYRIREKASIEFAPDDYRLATLLGDGAWDILRKCGGDSLSLTVASARLGAARGVDLLLPASSAEASIARLAEATMLDSETLETLRVEALVPRWGAELDEKVIPLEAGLLDAISFTKGCYVGQEIIARIRSRGHTNRTLRQLRLSVPAAAGEDVYAASGPRIGEAIGRVTSSALSPLLGPIALAYVRNEYAGDGEAVRVGGQAARIAVAGL